MDLTRIIAITGKPGLFELVSQTKGGFIVKDLLTKKKISINANSQVSLLQNISIYTQDSNEESETPLSLVLVSISKKHNFSEIRYSKNNTTELRSLMEEAVPNYAKEKVYDSDLKKLFSWYNILINNSIITEKSISEFEENLEKAKEEELKSTEK